ncbi:MAG: ABC transporter ATP-binding protein [Actinomycetota bacterium]|nr:ABC transporter ATP-binding protein [Actinomycetota bacterium]
MENLIQVEGLTVERGGKRVLEGVTFAVPAGSLTGLIGPSGSGKTTVMRAVAGLQRHVDGLVRVAGFEAGSRAAREVVGYQPQRPAVYLDLTVRQNISYFAAMIGVDSAGVSEAIERVSLGAQAAERVERLSGGQVARVSLAIALLGSPQVLLLDEPTVGLDPVLRDELWRLFASLASLGTALVVSSHVMDEAERCERLLLLRDGRLLADAAPGTLKAETSTQDLDSAFLSLIRQGRP